MNLFIDSYTLCLEVVSELIIFSKITGKKIKDMHHPITISILYIFSNMIFSNIFPNVFGWLIIFPINYFMYSYIFDIPKPDMFFAYSLTYTYLTITEDFIALIFMRFNLRPEILQPIIGSTITIIVIAISCIFIPLFKIYQYILNGSFVIKLGTIHITILLLIEIGISRFTNYNTYAMLSLILSFAVVIITTDYLLIKQQRTIARQQESLENYQTYEPMMDSLIEDIRRRQHDFSNELNAINMISCTYNNYESLSHALNEHAEHLSRDFHSTDLVHLNMKVLAGFLHSKKATAAAEKKDLDIKINSYVLNSQMPEYELIKVVGILIDNALEATDENGTVKLEIGSRDDKLTFATVNKGPKLTPKLRSDMVKAGYTTKEPACSDKTNGKRKRPAKRGYGLANALDLLTEYGGELYIENPESDGDTLIRFEFIV